MQVILNPEQEKFIQSQIKQGKYTHPEEVVSEALKLLNIYQRQQNEKRVEALRERILIGTAEIEQGKVTDGEVVFERLQERLRNEFGLRE